MFYFFSPKEVSLEGNEKSHLESETNAMAGRVAKTSAAVATDGPDRTREGFRCTRAQVVLRWALRVCV